MKIDPRGIRVQDDFEIKLLDLNGYIIGTVKVEARDYRSAVRKALNGYLADDIALVNSLGNMMDIYRVDIAGHALLIGVVKKVSK